MRADWTGQILDQDRLVLLFVNYIFFSFIVMTFVLFLMCLTQTTSLQLDISSMMSLLTLCFIMGNIILANYLVYTMQVNNEMRLIIA